MRKAIEDLDAAIEIDPSMAEAYTNRGMAYLALGERQRSLDDLDRAIRIDADLPGAHYVRAVAYTLLGRDAEADLDVSRAVELGFARGRVVREVEQARLSR